MHTLSFSPLSHRRCYPIVSRAALFSWTLQLHCYRRPPENRPWPLGYSWAKESFAHCCAYCFVAAASCMPPARTISGSTMGSLVHACYGIFVSVLCRVLSLETGKIRQASYESRLLRDNSQPIGSEHCDGVSHGNTHTPAPSPGGQTSR